MEKAQKIRLLILDVDGVLTNGQLWIDGQGELVKAFHIHDGLGIQLLRKAGIEVAIITAKESTAVSFRATQLGITHVFQGQTHKLIAYETLKKTLALEDEQIAYCGDDLPDLSPLKKAGLRCAPANAVPEILAIADWVSTRQGGQGAVRELAEFILKTQERWQAVYEPYL